MKVKSESEVALNHVRLLATPWPVAHQAPPSMGFSRQDYWSGVPLISPIVIWGLINPFLVLNLPFTWLLVCAFQIGFVTVDLLYKRSIFSCCLCISAYFANPSPLFFLMSEELSRLVIYYKGSIFSTKGQNETIQYFQAIAWRNKFCEVFSKQFQKWGKLTQQSESNAFTLSWCISCENPLSHS